MDAPRMPYSLTTRLERKNAARATIKYPQNSDFWTDFRSFPAARPRLVLDLSGLDRIRRDASATRDSLLSGEELAETEDASKEAEDAPVEYASAVETAAGIPLESLYIRVIRALLEGRDAAALLREEHVMPSVAADEINEALFEEFGDTVMICDDDRLSLVEDYREALEQLAKGAE